MRLLDRVKNLLVIGKKKRIHTKILGGIGLFAVLFLLILAPLRKTIAIKKTEWEKMETQLIAGRAKLDAYLRLDKSKVDAQLEELRKKIPSKSPTSAILDELTRRGRELNIEFVSITPQSEKIPLEASALPLKYKILPIEINMRATYRSFAEYISLLENLESCFASVGDFRVRKDENIFPKLSIQLVVNTYIVEQENGQE